jgi:Skp family chaperone for outer membrane proteins
MKLRRLHLPVAAALIVGAVLLGKTLAQPQTVPQTVPEIPVTRAAICDVAEVFDNYLKGKQLSTEFRQRGERLNTEDEQRAKAITDIDSELQGLVPGSDAYQARQQEQQRLKIEREVWRQMQVSQVDGERLKLTGDMYDEILAAVRKVAARRGVNLVLYDKHRIDQPASLTDMLQQVELKKVLYADETIDITGDVLEELNTAYEASHQP